MRVDPAIGVRREGPAERPYLGASGIDVWRVVEAWQALGHSAQATADSLASIAGR